MSEFEKSEKSEKMEKEKIGKETVLVSPFGCGTGKNTYLRMLVFALFMLAAVGFLSSCATSGKSDAPEEEMTTTPPEEPEEPEEPVVPDDLSVAKQQASDASDAAMTASSEAKAAAEAAEMAGAMHATLQTGDAGYKMYLEAANDAYQDAMTAYNEAKKQSAAAQAATTLVAAITAAVKAETAQADAETAQQAAEEARDMAMMAAENLLMIEGTVKNVGDSMVDATTGKYTVTAQGQTTITGLLSEPMTTGKSTNGRMPVAAVLAGTPPTAYVSPLVNAESRGDVKIGKILDTSDDMARLLIITHYAGTETVRVYDEIGGDVLNIQTDKEGKQTFETGANPTFNADSAAAPTLKSEGMFYLATGGDTPNILEPLGLDEDVDPPVQQGDTVGDDAKPVMVYSFKEDADDNDETPDTTAYVVRQSSMTDDDAGTTTVVYQRVQIKIEIDRDGDGAVNNVDVMAKIPARAAYDHVHFGVWVKLGDAKANGDQSPSDLGIGFVQSIGDGMTGDDMPNNGKASYSGNWAAVIQVADVDGDGLISLESGEAMVEADFTKDEITAILTDLARLNGTITGNTFSGTEATPIGRGLDVNGDFTGSFSGGFYGAKADETAGVFDFASDGNKDGAFRGAFGGNKQ